MRDIVTKMAILILAFDNDPDFATEFFKRDERGRIDLLKDWAVKHGIKVKELTLKEA
jgi:hypothetical protein